MNDGIKFMILFFWCIGMMFFMNNQTIFIIQFILFLIACFWFVKPYLRSEWFDIKSQIRKYKQYTLTDEETQLWESIKQKANNGYSEFCEECKKDSNYMSWPWMSPKLTVEERALVDKIHAVYFGKDYYLTDPIGASQADWTFYDDIKDKVKKIK